MLSLIAGVKSVPSSCCVFLLFNVTVFLEHSVRYCELSLPILALKYLSLSLSLSLYIYRLSQEECARLRESVPYVKVYRYNPKHLYPKLNGYGDNGQRSFKL